MTLLDSTNAKVSPTRAALGTITNNDTPAARRRALDMMLAGVGRTLAMDAMAVIVGRFG